MSSLNKDTKKEFPKKEKKDPKVINFLVNSFKNFDEYIGSRNVGNMSYIQKLRELPEDRRKRISSIFTLSFLIVAVILWIIGLQTGAIQLDKGPRSDVRALGQGLDYILESEQNKEGK